MKKFIVGILAHVDAGKTTLSEAMLYTAGSIRKLGRVDHRDAFLDTYQLEKSRGITIFSKQAELKYRDMDLMLMDTPGHTDFSAEMERTLQVLDYAVLVISGKDGVQGHTGTLYQLLRQYRIPTFLFINKMDMEGVDRNMILDELQQTLDPGCVDFSQDREEEAFFEQMAMCEESLLEEYLETGGISERSIREAVRRRKIFPCYFGSALKVQGVEYFMDGLKQYMRKPEYPKEFGARVYKISRDHQGNRLTYLKVTGGALRVKDVLSNGNAAGEEQIWEEKADQLRIYSGDRFRTEEQVEAGSVCAVTGLSKTFPGQGLGMEKETCLPVLEPVLVYGVVLPEGCDVHRTFLQLKELEEEDPLLKIVWSEQLQEIHIQVMGEVQLEILQNLIAERFALEIRFSEGRISYKETIAEPLMGAGHFEPLRHYAEVHLLLEPGARGSGVTLDTQCSEDLLDKNWQRLILTHLKEREHPGVLTGSPLTDVKITLLAGRAHLKHTEGGDFRQATYRAVRQGLKKGERKGVLILLEPWYDFHLEVPTELVGRAMADIQQMGGSFQSPQVVESMSLIEGKAPVASMKNYMTEVNAYTKGCGRLFCTLRGYEPCHNQQEIVENIGYDSDRDMENPADSVFCSHGTGVTVKWDEVDRRLHVECRENPGEAVSAEERRGGGKALSYGGSAAEDAELEQIFRQTYGESKRKEQIYSMKTEAKQEKVEILPTEIRKEYLLVDGYNIIFAWKELRSLASINLDASRQALIDILCNYQGFRKNNVVLVFDAYRVSGGERAVEQHGGIHVVYTQEAETADMYIERVTYEIGKDYYVRVATSDHLQQMIIIGNGAHRVSAGEFKEEVDQENARIAAVLEEYNRRNRRENRNTIQIPLQ